MDEQRQPGLEIVSIFLESARFAHREDALGIPANTEHPSTSVDIAIRLIDAPDGKNSVIGLRVTTENQPDALYHFSIEVMAVVQALAGEENLPPAEYVRTAGIATLYPFLREAVANLTMRGRFGPVWLNPFNVQAMVQELQLAESVKPTPEPPVAKARATTRSARRC